MPLRKIPLGLSEGGIEEEVTNSNGTAIKFTSGLMICYFSVNNGPGSNWGTYGSLYRLIVSWTYPVSFVGVPSIFADGGVIGSGNSWVAIGARTSTNVSLRLLDVVDRVSADDLNYSAMAIGRWK